MVIVEHFELIFPFLKRNADLLVGIGEEIIITRPNMFGPLPENIAKIVHKSVVYRKAAHTLEDCVCISWERDMHRTVPAPMCVMGLYWNLSRSRM